jgi:hypothetical protein
MRTAVWRPFASYDTIMLSNEESVESRNGLPVINMRGVERAEREQFGKIAWAAALLDPAMWPHFDNCGGSRVETEEWQFSLILRCAVEPDEVDQAVGADGDVAVDDAVDVDGGAEPWMSCFNEKSAKVKILMRPRGARVLTEAFDRETTRLLVEWRVAHQQGADAEPDDVRSFPGKLRDAWNLECSKFASYMDHTKKGFYGDPVPSLCQGKSCATHSGRRTRKSSLFITGWPAFCSSFSGEIWKSSV